MENENKNVQPTEEELQEKVRQDVSEKIAEAAAEVQDEIDMAAETVEEVETAEVEETDAEEFDAVEGEETVYEYEESYEDAEEYEEVPVKEPKKVTLNLSSLVLSLIGTAIIGALLLFVGLKIPGWVASIPEGKTVATVNGTDITDLDMKNYIYTEATNYLKEAGAQVKNPSEFDWSQEVEPGKTAEALVKERALDAAIKDIILIQKGEEMGVEFDEKATRAEVEMQNQQLISQYSEEIVILNAEAQALTDMKQYTRKVVQYQNIQAVETDIEAAPEKYYPEDMSVLNGLENNTEISAKHILIKFEEAAETEEGEEAAPVDNTAKKTQAEEILARINGGEDFDALMKEFNEDTGEPETGYTFGPGEMVAEFEEAAKALKIDEVSGLVESTYGYHIIKRTAGIGEVKNFWMEDAKVKTKGAYDKMSLAEILAETEAATEEFQKKMAELQGAASK